MNREDEKAEIVDLGQVTVETRGASMSATPDDNLSGLKSPHGGIADD